MTCIVGIVHNQTVYMGGDSQATAGWVQYSIKNPKVFLNGEFLIGFAGSFRMLQLVQYKFTPPKNYENHDPLKYMIVEFVEELRNVLKNGGAAAKNNEVEKGATFLVGYKSRLFRIESDYQVMETSHGYDAIGCGNEFAIGSLFTTQLFQEPEDRITWALKSSAQHSTGVSSPFIILKLNEGN